MDHIPMTNIMPFGMCSRPPTQTVAAATAAALGVLTPMPCIPATPAPWVAGAPTVLLGNFPSLDNVSQLMCIWGGVITFNDAGEETVANTVGRTAAIRIDFPCKRISFLLTLLRQ